MSTILLIVFSLSGLSIVTGQTIEVDTATFRGLVKDAKRAVLLDSLVEVYEQSLEYADSVMFAQSQTIYFLRQANDNQSQQINLYMENEKDYKKIIKRQNTAKWIDRSVNGVLLATVIGLGLR